MTDVEQRLREIEERWNLTTHGTWEVFQGDDPNNPDDYDGPYPKWRGVAVAGDGGAIIVERCGGDGYTDSILNADFIAHVHQDLPWLLALLREKEEENRRLRERLAHLENGIRKLLEEMKPRV